MLRPFRIHEPATVEEASRLLGEHGDAAAVYAGGTELLVVMKEGLAHFPHLINIKTIPGLDGVDEADGASALRIGALATHHKIESSRLVNQRAPLLAAMEEAIANVRVRHAGTIGGNLCFAEPHSDPATLLVCWGATYELTSSGGRREIAASDFIVGLMETVRRPDELMTAITIPLPHTAARVAFLRFSTHERPTANVAVMLEEEPDSERIATARIVVGCVGAKPQRVDAAEALLIGERLEPRLSQAAGNAAAIVAEVLPDPLESEDYKRQIVRTLVARALSYAAAGISELIDAA